MNKKRLIEWSKTGIIAVLCVLAVFLGAQTELFRDFFKSIPVFSALAGALKDTQTTPVPPAGIIANEAARPVVIVVTDESGEHYGLKYDTAALDRAYERTSTMFSEALSTAQMPVEIAEGAWRSALSAYGIYFEYSSPVRLATLAGWLGVNPPYGLEAHAPRRVCVTFSDDGNTLYFESGGAFYSCETAAPGGGPSGLGGYATGGARYAFEAGGDFSFAPYMLISPGTTHPVLLSDVPVTPREAVDALLLSIGVTGQLESSYLKRADSLKFHDPAFTITAAPAGRTLLSGSVGGADGSTADEGQMIERARVIAAGTIGKASGAARVYFDAIETDGNKQVVTFKYHAAGGLIHMYEDGYAAKITFTGGAITEIDLIFRTFTETGEMERLWPELQILAAAGAEFALCYADGGAGYLYPYWAVIEEA